MESGEERSYHDVPEELVSPCETQLEILARNEDTATGLGDDDIHQLEALGYL